ncbi:YaaC family protein [Siminovitchia sediminis]|uniref:YaaC family protein n=1 Tax=Siminovitchia sediminis TaxID=1274353 RepID=A0ABW4KPD7_9BACI
MFHFSNNLEVFFLFNPHETWLQFNYFQSASTVQLFLKKCYLPLEPEEADRKSYDNCYPFMYYIEQAQSYYQQASKSPFSIKPVLLFYGYVHLIKAGLLTVDPYYPSTTSVLAHGVSTRKKKKRNYEFLQDEVKIQKHGLCTHMADKLFQIRNLEGEKFRMGHLLSLIPELDDLFVFVYQKKNMVFLRQIGSDWHIPEELQRAYHMGADRLKQFLESKHPQPIHWKENESGKTIISGPCADLKPPFRYDSCKRVYGINASIQAISSLPDVIIHYLLLYNLSMIARYETEWWFDLIKTAADNTYPFIHTFLEISERKSPEMILKLLIKTST